MQRFEVVISTIVHVCWSVTRDGWSGGRDVGIGVEKLEKEIGVDRGDLRINRGIKGIKGRDQDHL